MATRMVSLLLVYLTAETLGLLALAVGPLTSLRALPGGERRFVNHAYAVQRVWTGSLFGAFRRLFDLRIEVEGIDALAHTPFILLVRHVSLVDTLVPAVFVANPQRLHLRYVLKKELLSDPCLDVAGSRLPNFFVDRDPSDSEAELAAVRRLVAGLDRGEGAVIFPEGTRFRPDRLARSVERLRTRDPEAYERARTLLHVLPPRPGGTLAMLEGAPRCDVVVCAHHGFDGFTYLRTMWSGALVGRTLRLRFTRFPRAGIPEGARQRIGWLYDRWSEVDAWVGSHEQGH